MSKARHLLRLIRQTNDCCPMHSHVGMSQGMSQGHVPKEYAFEMACRYKPHTSHSSTVKPLNTADLGTGKKAAVFRKRRYWDLGVIYNIQNPYLGLGNEEMGGGIGRAAVLRGTTV